MNDPNIHLKVHELCFQGILRLKQSVETYKYFEKLHLEKCQMAGGWLESSAKQFMEVLLRDIALGIYKCCIDDSDKGHIGVYVLADGMSSEALEKGLKMLGELLPDISDKYRHTRLGHIGFVKNYEKDEETGEQYVLDELKTYASLVERLPQYNNQRRLFVIMDCLEVVGAILINEARGDSKAYSETIESVKTNVGILFLYLDGTLKSAEEAEMFIELVKKGKYKTESGVGEGNKEAGLQNP